MSIENIIKKIEADAEVECKVLRDRASQEIKQIQEQAKNQAGKERESILKHANQQAETNINRAIVSAKLESRINLLKAKQDMIAACFEGAYNKTLKSSPSDYLKLIEKKLLEFVETGDEKIIFGSLHKDKLNNEFIQKINKQLLAKEKKGRLTIQHDSRPIKAGFVLVKGKKEINSSLEQLFKLLKDRLIVRINNILFGEGT